MGTADSPCCERTSPRHTYHRRQSPARHRRLPAGETTRAGGRRPHLGIVVCGADCVVTCSGLYKGRDEAMGVAHEPWLVVLSLVVAIQGAYVGLSLAVQVAEAVGLRRRLLLAAAAISLAVAVWSMHFVGMLAARLPFPVD